MCAIAMSIWLFIAAVDDMCSKTIHLLLIAAGFVPVILSFVSEEITLPQRLLGLGTGLVMLLLTWITKEKLGKGDALLMCITGMTLGVCGNIKLVMLSFALAVPYSIVLLLRGRLNKRTEIAFVPFLFLAYLMMLAGA